MSNITDVTATTFDEEVLQSPLPVLVDFFAPWCSYCKPLMPVLEEVAQELDGQLKVVKYDVSQDSDFAKTLGVDSIPTMLFYKGGKKIKQLLGSRPKERILAQAMSVIAYEE